MTPPKEKHVLKFIESHRYQVNTLGILACNFSTFFKVSQSLVVSEDGRMTNQIQQNPANKNILF